MSPFSGPVLGGAALLSAPALWGALVDGTTTTQTAVSRFLVTALICWLAFGILDLLVGPPPRPSAEPGTVAEAGGLATEDDPAA